MTNSNILRHTDSTYAFITEKNDGAISSVRCQLNISG